MEMEKNEEPVVNTEQTGGNRNPWVALLFSLIQGLGQVYNGQLKKGLLFVIATIFILLILPYLGLVFTFTGAVLYGFLLLSIKIWSMADAFIVARRTKNYEFKSYNKWYYYLLYIVSMIGMAQLYIYSGLSAHQTFSIPHSANEPAIMVGDVVVANTRAYENHNPDYGDMIVFYYDNGLCEIPYTFRVVGLPEDHISIEENRIVVNGEPSELEFIDSLRSDHFSGGILEYQETLPNGFRHTIRIGKGWSTANSSDWVNNIILPEDYYYVAGNFRNNAQDSRYIGLVHRDKIIGKVLYTLWGESVDRINVRLDE